MNSQEIKRLEKAEIKEFEAKLIVEIKSHICLYAKDDPSYSNKLKRQDAWEDISTILGKTVEECQKKWTSLRDSFRSYFKAENNIPSGSGATPKIKWVHFQSLKFLIPYVKVPADDCGNFSDEFVQTFEEGTSKDTNSQDEEVLLDVGEEISSNIHTHKKQRAQKRKCSNADEPLERVLKAIENSDKRKPMQVFFDSVAQQVENLSQQWQIRFQAKVLNLLAEELQSATDS